MPQTPSSENVPPTQNAAPYVTKNTTVHIINRKTEAEKVGSTSAKRRNSESDHQITLCKRFAKSNSAKRRRNSESDRQTTLRICFAKSIMRPSLEVSSPVDIPLHGLEPSRDMIITPSQEQSQSVPQNVPLSQVPPSTPSQKTVLPKNPKKTTSKIKLGSGCQTTLKFSTTPNSSPDLISPVDVAPLLSATPSQAVTPLHGVESFRDMIVTPSRKQSQDVPRPAPQSTTLPQSLTPSLNVKKSCPKKLKYLCKVCGTPDCGSCKHCK